MFKKSRVICLLGLLLALVGCSQINNKVNLDEDLFENGQKLTQYYSQAIQENEEPSDEVTKLADDFQVAYETGDYSSEDEELFISDIVLIKNSYELYVMAKGTENITGEDQNSEGIKIQIKDKLTEMNELFGVQYEK